MSGLNFVTLSTFTQTFIISILDLYKLLKIWNLLGTKLGI